MKMWVSKSCSALFLYYSLTGAQADGDLPPPTSLSNGESGVTDVATKCTPEDAFALVDQNWPLNADKSNYDWKIVQGKGDDGLDWQIHVWCLPPWKRYRAWIDENGNKPYDRTIRWINPEKQVNYDWDKEEWRTAEAVSMSEDELERTHNIYDSFAANRLSTWQQVNNRTGSAYIRGVGGLGYCNGSQGTWRWSNTSDIPVCPDYNAVVESPEIHCDSDKVGSCGCINYNYDYKISKLTEYTTIWTDRNYKIWNIPEYLINADLIMHSHKTINKDLILSYLPGGTGKIYAFSEGPGYRNGDWVVLMGDENGNSDWVLLDERMNWGDGAEFWIWSKDVVPGEIDDLVIKVSATLVGGVAFVLDC